MKLAELRSLISGHKSEDLQAIIVELYKKIPKKTIEEHRMDELVRDPGSYAGLAKALKSEPQRTLDELEPDIVEFVADAKNQYYFAPNSIIRKKDRPKWRFIVKRFIHDLQLATDTPEDTAKAAELLEQLYALLCEAGDYILFSTEDPFRSVGIAQERLYSIIVQMIRRDAPPKKWVAKAIALAIEHSLGRETLHETLWLALLDHLNTAPLKELAIEEAEQLLADARTQLRLVTKKSNDAWNKEYAARNKIESLTELVLYCRFGLSEYEEGAQFFLQHDPSSSREVTYYRLLSRLLRADQKDLWLRFYQQATREGVPVRNSLIKADRTIRETGRLPAYL